MALAAEDRMLPGMRSHLAPSYTAFGFVLAAACSTPTSPVPTPTPAPPAPTTRADPAPAPYRPINVRGVVTSAETSAPLGGVVIYLNGRYQTTTDRSGHYDLAGLLDEGPLGSDSNVLWTRMDGHDIDMQYVRSDAQDARLRVSDIAFDRTCRRHPDGRRDVVSGRTLSNIRSGCGPWVLPSR